MFLWESPIKCFFIKCYKWFFTFLKVFLKFCLTPNFFFLLETHLKLKVFFFIIITKRILKTFSKIPIKLTLKNINIWNSHWMPLINFYISKSKQSFGNYILSPIWFYLPRVKNGVKLRKWLISNSSHW